jgi:hypothetical protein
MGLGTAVDIGQLRCWLALPLMAVAFWIKLKQEERLLLRHFPQEYPIYKRQVKALFHHLQTFLALKGRVELEPGEAAFLRAVAKEFGTHLFIGALIGLGRENLPKVLVDGPIVVNDQDSPVEVVPHLIA